MMVCTGMTDADEVNRRKGRKDAATEAVDAGRWAGRWSSPILATTCVLLSLTKWSRSRQHRVLGHPREEVDVVVLQSTAPRRPTRQVALDLGAVVLRVLVVVGWWCGLPFFLGGAVVAAGTQLLKVDGGVRAEGQVWRPSSRSVSGIDGGGIGVSEVSTNE